MIKTHCQICGRQIKTVSGYPQLGLGLRLQDTPEGREPIAHHGYQRPWGEGYQTASCFGARWRSYEVACDALPPAIEQLDKILTGEKERLASLLSEPPATLHYVRRDAWGKVRVEKTLERPENFNPKDYAGLPQTYANEYATQRGRLESNIRHMSADLGALRRRLAEWVAPKIN
jgi:hypothetical protein